MNRNALLGILVLAVVAVVGIFYITKNDAADLEDAGEGQASADVINEDDVSNSDTDTPFTFRWDDYPEYQPVLEPRNLNEFLSVHEPTDRVYGDPEAKVTVMEFFSYTCPYCKGFHESTYQQILTDYVDTGLIRFVKRDFPREPGVGFEVRAGSGAMCFIDSAQSRRFADLMFAQQSSLRQAPDQIEALVNVFRAAGMDEDMSRSCIEDQRNWNLIVGRRIRAQRIANVNATPTIFINGDRFTGDARDYADISSAIERALARAN